MLTPENKVAVEAGPGSGKTAILIARAGIMAENEPPDQTMLITFTRKAARQMKERLSQFTNTSEMYIGTFHSIAFSIIKEWNNDGKKFRIWDEDDRISALKNIYGKDKMNDVRNLSRLIGFYFIDRPIDPKEVDILKEGLAKYKEFIKEKEQKENIHIYDLESLIKIAIKTIEENNITIKNILVDEAQDMNPIQKKFVDALNPETLFLVGDPKQSIYEFRGATSEFFKKVMEEYPLFTLHKNYRSTPQILNMAESIYKRGLEPVKEEEGEAKVKYVADTEEEFEFIEEKARETLQNEQETLAVLSRTRLEAHNISVYLTKRKIPHTIIGEYNLFKRKEVKDCIAYLEVVSRKFAISDLLRIVNEPRRGIGKTKKKEIEEEFDKTRNDIINILDRVSERWNDKPKKNAKKLVDIIRKAREMQEKEKVRDILEYILKETGYFDSIEDNRKMHVKVLLDIATEFNSIGDFIIYTHLGQEDSENNNKNIIVSTIHSVKGLEFDTVIIANAVKGYLPFGKDDNEQEKNLFYVAVTRAKKNLYIVVPKVVKTINGEEQESELSPYVRDIINTKRRQNESKNRV